MRKQLLLIAFVCFNVGVYAQKDAPFWLDPYQRESKYPADQYIVGLNSELVGKKQSLSAIYKNLNQASRNQIIESIHVNVKSETVMNISIVNTESTQLLDQNSVSISKAELVGLKFENYYTKKKKTAFSFSYVKIQDIIEFNLDIIKVNTAAIDKNVAIANTSIANGNKEKAIDLLFESQVKLKEINQAAVMLMALDQDDQLDFNKIGQMKLDIAQGTNDFFNKGTLNVQELASFYAYGLQLQLGDAGISVCKGNVGYETSGVESKFSAEFNNRVLNKLSDLELVKMGESGCDFTLSGNFNNTNNTVVLVTNLVDATGKVRATVNNKFPYESINFGELTFMPENYDYINKLSLIKLISTENSYTIKKVNLFKNPIQLSVQLNGNSMKDIPIHFKIIRKDEVEYQTVITSNKMGVAELVINTEQIKKSGELILHADVDVAALLGAGEDSEFIKKILTEYPLQERLIKLNVLAPTIYVSSKEYSLGKPLGISVLAPSLKNALIELDYKFVDKAEGADFLIIIESETRSGQGQGKSIHFSYLDATVSMVRSETGKEIYKSSLSSVKGSGANFDLASAKAYEKAKKSIGNDISYELEFNQK